MPLPGWASRDPQYLCECIKAKHLALLDWAWEQDIELTTIETARDLERQKHYKKIGASRILRSKHLVSASSAPAAGSLAFDIAPTEYLALKAWNPRGPLWQKLGKTGEKLGLTWGGRWASFPDLPHFQLEKCTCEK